MQDLGEFLEGYDFMLSPGQQLLPFPVGAADPSDPGGDPDPSEEWWGMDAIANLTGQPVTAVPWDLVEGVPVGLQLMGRRFGDAQLLAAAGVWDASARSHPADAPFVGAAQRCSSTVRLIPWPVEAES